MKMFARHAYFVILMFVDLRFIQNVTENKNHAYKLTFGQFPNEKYPFHCCRFKNRRNFLSFFMCQSTISHLKHANRICFEESFALFQRSWTNEHSCRPIDTAIGLKWTGIDKVTLVLMNDSNVSNWVAISSLFFKSWLTKILGGEKQNCHEHTSKIYSEICTIV